ncbi:DUF2589 domain-containing protein [Streptomyces sp. NPDC020747]|uniref:DUF2589 domain-containing protein n=1 Tax=Streptomyces sp. NPDC020747 TaxID=3365086 RepID=UPI00378FDCA9
MPDPGSELSSLNFESLIGGPMVAAVHAQVQSALATVNFVKQVGFRQPPAGGVTPGDTTTGEPATVTFSYKKQVAAADGNGVDEKPASLTVPLLSILPIPYLRIDEVNIDFLAKIDSVQFRQVDEQIKVGVDADAQASWGWGSARIKASFAYQRDTKEGSKDTRSYSMGVKARAVQEELPGGMAKVLGILESMIQEKITE